MAGFTLRGLVGFIKYFPGLSLHNNRINRFLSRSEYDAAVRKTLIDMINNREHLPDVAAIYRVKNGENTIAASILSIASLCKEIVVVDNGSTDNTIKIVERLTAELSGITDIKLYHYEKVIGLAGENYSEEISDGKRASLATFYNFAFSLSDCAYLMKVDAHYIFTQSGLQKIQNKLRKNYKRVCFRGAEIFGKKLSYEAFIFENKNFTFKDSLEYERIIFSEPFTYIEKIMCTIYVPVFLHVKRLNYIRALDHKSSLRKLYNL